MNEFDNPERRIILQGTPSEEQLRVLSEFAVGMGLRMVTYNKHTDGTEHGSTPSPEYSETHGTTATIKEDESATGLEEVTAELFAESEIERKPFRRKGSKLSFQKFGYETQIDKDEDKFVQRAQKGKVSSVWGALASGRFSDSTRNAKLSLLSGGQGYKTTDPLDAKQLLGVGLPDYEYVPVVTETYKSYSYRPNNHEGEEYTYIETENCDNIDLDSLARYVVAVASRVNELHQMTSFKSKQTHAMLKKFIPEGIGMPSLQILAEYCEHMLADDPDSPVGHDALHNAVEIFADLARRSK